MYRRILIFTLLLLSLLLPMTAAAGILDDIRYQRTIGFVPRTADNIGQQLDAQILRILGPSGYGRDSVTIAATVPVFLGDFTQTSPLARQMSEELSRYFMELGYKVDEIRKGDEVVVRERQGEFLLTRDVSRLQNCTVTTEMILVGTYTVTDRSVRFNIRLLHTPSQEVLAMAAGTVPITAELAPLIADNDATLRPSVRTRLPR